MVCDRCVLTVKATIEEMGYTPVRLSLGQVSFLPGHTPDKAELDRRLDKLGLRVLEDKETHLIARIKELVKEVYSGDFDFPVHFRFADLVRHNLQVDYEEAASAFIHLEKTTLEQYIIEYRLDRVKEMLVYTDQTLASIAFRLNFNSTAHLSAQFKQRTGLTASHFKEIKRSKDSTGHQ